MMGPEWPGDQATYNMSEFLQKGTERPLHEGVKVKLALQWKPHDIGDARTT